MVMFWVCYLYIKDICNIILKVLKFMIVLFCKRNFFDNEEINYYLIYFLKFLKKGGGFELCYMIIWFKYNILLFWIKVYMIFV